MVNFMTSKRGEWTEWPVELTALTWAMFAAPFLLFWIFSSLRNKHVKKYNLPPCPPTWPIIGNIASLMDSSRPIHSVIIDLAKTYGPIMLLKVGVQNLVFVTDPDIAMEFLKGNDPLFAYRPLQLPVAKYLTYGDSSLALGHPGDYHSFVRKLFTKELLLPKKVEAFRPLRTAELDVMIRECLNTSLRNESINLHLHLNSMMLNIILQLAFKRTCYGTESKNHEQWLHIIPAYAECYGLVLAETCHPSLKWVDTLTGNRKRCQKTFKELDTLLQEVLDDHTRVLDALSPEELEVYDAKDFMDVMLLHRNGEHGKFINDQNIKGVSLDVIAGGSDTILTTTEWAMAELLINPHVMEKLQQEVDSVVGNDRFVTEADVGKMPYLHAVFKETLRLHMPLPTLLPHTNMVDCKIGIYDIPANSIVNVNAYALSRSASRWKDPLKFDPERFLGNPMAAAINANGAYPELMPFGRGRRICPGIGFAHVTMYIVLARLVHSFDWSLPDGTTASNMDMSETFGVVAAKQAPIIAVPKPRLPSHVYNSL